MGYKQTIREVDVLSSVPIDVGNILLQDSVFVIAETVVTGDRLKGKSEGNKTIYFMNKKIQGASGSAPDVLRHVPGIQVDLKQNISLEGSQNILLLVNGKERDNSFISQLNPARIDRVEVLNAPSSKYDADVSGISRE